MIKEKTQNDAQYEKKGNWKVANERSEGETTRARQEIDRRLMVQATEEIRKGYVIQMGNSSITENKRNT